MMWLQVLPWQESGDDAARAVREGRLQATVGSGDGGREAATGTERVRRHVHAGRAEDRRRAGSLEEGREDRRRLQGSAHRVQGNVRLQRAAEIAVLFLSLGDKRDLGGRHSFLLNKYPLKIIH